MKQLSIQVQATPRALAQARKHVLRAVTNINPNLVVWSDAGYTYAKVNLETENPAPFCTALVEKLKPKKFDMIVICQGNSGWNDYVLLGSGSV